MADEIAPRERLHVGMHCFWTGEACLGDLEDVVATRTGWMSGTEVVELDVRAGRAHAVVDAVKARGCGSVVFSTDPKVLTAARRAGLHATRPGRFSGYTQGRPSRARSYGLEGFFPLTDLQGTRVNALLSRRQDPSAWLSPRQRQFAMRLTEKTAGPLPDARSAPDLAAAVAKLEAALDPGAGQP